MGKVLGLNRAQLAGFLKDPQSIKAFEQLLNDVGGVLPDTIEQAAATASSALAVAQVALSALAELTEEMERMRTPALPEPEIEQMQPAVELGTLSAQNHDAVDVTGGRVGLDAGSVTEPSFCLGGDVATGLYQAGANSWGITIVGVNLVTYSATGAAFTQNVSTAKQLISSITTGTPPLQVASTTLVPNLYVDRAALADLATTATTATTANTANTLASPATFPANATDLPTVITLANALKAAAIAKGL